MFIFIHTILIFISLGSNGKTKYSKTCLKRTLYEKEFVLNGNIFMSRDFEAETGVKYPG
jgi:hypothetical protein